MKNETRGIRNNNPLNIRYNKANRWKGKVLEKHDPHFEEFVAMEYGFRAALVMMDNYIKHHHCNTIEKIVTRWAPPSENNTASYIGHICRMTGLGGREWIRAGSFARDEVVWAMAQIESGKGILAYREDFEQARKGDVVTKETSPQ